MRTIGALLLACLLILGAAGATGGCSSRTTTTTTHTTEPGPGDNTTVHTETKTTEQETSGPSGGILSSTINAIGFVLALPFKLVGGLIELIF